MTAKKDHFTYGLKVGDTVWLEPLGNAKIHRSEDSVCEGKVTAITSRSVAIKTYACWDFKLPLGCSVYRNLNLGFGFNVFPTEAEAKKEFDRRRKILTIRDLFNRNLWEEAKSPLTAEQIDEIYQICNLG